MENSCKTDQKERALLDLMNQTGYKILQENGQRRYGPPPGWGSASPPDKGSEIFIGKIPRDCFEDELVPIFSRIGTIYELRLMMDFSGCNRGYGFLSYCDPNNAKIAVERLNNYTIRPGKQIGVVKSKDNCRLFVGKIPKDKSKEDVVEAMSIITEDVVNAIVHPSLRDHSMNRGYAFVEYANHRAAAMARRKLLPGKIQLFDCDIQVDWADPEPDVDDEVMRKVTVLYVRNLSHNCSEFQLTELFEFHKHLEVLKVKQIKDFAFVHYGTRDQAEEALSLIQNDPNFGQRLAASTDGLCVTWAKPANGQQQKLRRNHRYSNQHDYHNGHNSNYYSPNPNHGMNSGHSYRMQDSPNRSLNHHQTGDHYANVFASPTPFLPRGQNQDYAGNMYPHYSQTPRKNNFMNSGDAYQQMYSQNYPPQRMPMNGFDQYGYSTPSPRMPMSLSMSNNKSSGCYPQNPQYIWSNP